MLQSIASHDDEVTWIEDYQYSIPQNTIKLFAIALDKSQCNFELINL
jgi:hypothetical protein